MECIKDMAGRRKNVRFDELTSLLDNHIRHLFPGYNHHGNPHHSFTVRDQTFTIPKPRRGCVKKPYVEQFLNAMEAVGLFSEEIQ
jgi:hypothetical protein